MTRPLRLEYAGALYHLTARGNAQAAIYLEDSDRHLFLELLGKEVKQQRWVCYAYCLMDNHYHLLIETPEANLVSGMRRLNGVYTQAFNRRHQRVGHVFQGRYKSILVDKDSYLQELCRYIVLNPVRAKMVKEAKDYAWSSYRATIGKAKPLSWLAIDRVLGLFSGQTNLYRRFVAEGVGLPTVWENLKGQIYLGDRLFLKQMQKRASGRRVINVAQTQRLPARPQPSDIIASVSRAYRVTSEQLFDRTHQEPYQAAVYLLRRVANLPLRTVADIAGISPGRVAQIQRQLDQSNSNQRLQRLLTKYNV